MAAMMSKVIEAPNSTQNLMIWDTMGQEKYNSLTPFYYRGEQTRDPSEADIVLIVFDKGESRSFQRMKELVNSVLQECVKSPCRVGSTQSSPL